MEKAEFCKLVKSLLPFKLLISELTEKILVHYLTRQPKRKLEQRKEGCNCNYFFGDLTCLLGSPSRSLKSPKLIKIQENVFFCQNHQN